MTETMNAAQVNVKPANKRGAARLAAVQALYQMDLSGASLPVIVAEYEELRLGKDLEEETYREADSGYFRNIMAGVVAEQKSIDPEINGSLTRDWPLSRIDTILRAMLRCGTYELMKKNDVPARVIINEYIDIARAFYEVDEPRMVNGVLDKIARKLRPDEFKS